MMVRERKKILSRIEIFKFFVSDHLKHKNKNKSTVYTNLSSDVQAARHDCEGAF